MAFLTGIIVIAIIIWVVLSMKRDGDISKKGIVTEAVISRVESREHQVERPKKFGEIVDTEEFETEYTYYVTYKTQDGRDVEAKLGDVKVGTLKTGDTIRIKYLPQKPDYVISEQGS